MDFVRKHSYQNETARDSFEQSGVIHGNNELSGGRSFDNRDVEAGKGAMNAAEKQAAKAGSTRVKNERVSATASPLATRSQQAPPTTANSDQD